MKIEVVPGKYVVAVSGGVDSMVLLDLLRHHPDLELVVAHFDHGIREDSAQDEALVSQVAKAYGLTFVSGRGNLGSDVGEAAARTARYDFLRGAQDQYEARAIITAHHQDDVIETALINMLRGTNRRGLSSLKSEETLVRPLLSYPKSDIRAYAESHDISWREDSTNEDETYLRNRVRRQIVPKLSPEQRAELTKIISNAGKTNAELDMLLATQLELLRGAEGLERLAFVQLKHDLAREILALWLRQNGIADYDKKTLERLVVAAKTSKPSSRFDIIRSTQMVVSTKYLALESPKR